MTPPRPESDYLDADKTPTRMRTPPEDSQIREIEEIHARQFNRIEKLLEKWDEKVAGRVAAVETKAEQTSVTLFRAVPKRWRLAAIVGTLLGAGGVGSAGTAWGALESYRKSVATEALAEQDAKQLEQSVREHIASPHVDPNAAADLAIALDGLAKRLDAIDGRLERLEHRRSRGGD